MPWPTTSRTSSSLTHRCPSATSNFIILLERQALQLVCPGREPFPDPRHRRQTGEVRPAGRSPQQGENWMSPGPGGGASSVQPLHTAESKTSGSSPAHRLPEGRPAAQDGGPRSQAAFGAPHCHAGALPPWTGD